MTTDRELLELAAKAAGLDGWWESAYLSFILRSGGPWRPLTNDGDALRLAVKLGICFGPNFDGDTAVCFGANGRNILEPFGDDPDAATRLAITRAAAAIGEAMP